MEEGRLREPRVELPPVGSQSLLSCLCHLQIKEVLKSGTCDTVSFRVAQFLSLLTVGFIESDTLIWVSYRNIQLFM